MRALGRRLGPDPIWRLPALWMTFALLAVGLVLIGADHTYVVHLPLALAATTVLFAAHGVLVFLLVRGLDPPVPRPRLLLGVAVAWGGLVAAGLAALANAQLDAILVKLAAPSFVASWAAAIDAPVVEESLKAAAVPRGRPLPVRLGGALLALLGAVAMHALWNSPFGWSGTDFGRTGLAMLAVLVPVGVLLRLALREQARRSARLPRALADPTVAEAAEIAALGSPLRRFGVCWNAYVLAVLLCVPEVRRARHEGDTVDVRLGTAQLVGVVGLVLAGALGLAVLGIR